MRLVVLRRLHSMIVRPSLGISPMGGLRDFLDFLDFLDFDFLSAFLGRDPSGELRLAKL